MKLFTRPVLACVAATAGWIPAQAEGWQQVITINTPAFGPRMTFDEARGVVVLLGGGASQQTWTYDGNNWLLRAPLHVPPGRSQHCLGYDPLRQRVLLYGGYNGSSRLSDTWEWNGSDWIEVGNGADERLNSAMAFDYVRQQMLRFGGTGAGGVNAETRAWNGTTWVLLSTGGPAPRDNSAMVSDRLRGCVVLYGGYGPNGGYGNRFNDTWEWNGSVWAQRFAALTPPYLSGHSMAFHAGKGWSLIGNGEIPQSQGPVDNTDVYAWDGHNWSLRNLSVHPPAGPYAYDTIRERVVTIGGGQTWEYAAPVGVPASFQTFGVGCVGSGGVPTLAAAAGQLPFIGYPLHVTLANLGASPFIMPFGVVGFSNTAWGSIPLPADLGFLGFSGCTAYIEAIVSNTLFNQGGVANWTVQIPNQAVFVSLSMYLQGFVLDGGSPGGGVVTNAATAVIGRR